LFVIASSSSTYLSPSGPPRDFGAHDVERLLAHRAPPIWNIIDIIAARSPASAIQ
jgi:hypothetical protein